MEMGIFMRNIFTLFLALSLGYVLCVIAKKQEGLLKTLGYGLGLGILLVTLIYGLFTPEASQRWYKMGKKCGIVCGSSMSKASPQMKR